MEARRLCEERVDEAVDDHAQLVVAQCAERARRHRLSAPGLSACGACRARRHRRKLCKLSACMRTYVRWFVNGATALDKKAL